MARFEKGKSGNPAGKKPGTKSKSAEQIRKIIGAAISEYYDTGMLFDDLGQLEPKDRLTAIDRLTKHYVPAPLPEYLQLSDTDFERLVNEIVRRTKQ